MAAIEEVDFEFMKKFVFCMVDRIYCDQIEPLLNKFTAKEKLYYSWIVTIYGLGQGFGRRMKCTVHSESTFPFEENIIHAAETAHKVFMEKSKEVYSSNIDELVKECQKYHTEQKVRDIFMHGFNSQDHIKPLTL